ncbi:MAG: formate dehydrogenase accessory protein FdhE [Deltaproteobacteria bacterium]|nr:formate dehydrogenase accessory protein FdhE [Deltaproteobacteria bacterium]
MTQDLIAHIDRLMLQRPASKAALTPFRELVLLMAEVTPKVKPLEFEKEIRDIQQQEGFPLFSKEDLPLDFDAASDLLKKFLAHLGALDRDDANGLKTARKHAEADDKWTKDLFKAVLKQDEKALSQMAEEIDVDGKTLLFLGQIALRPSIHLLRNALTEDIDKNRWEHGYCPLCGSQPDMAYFAKTGKRYLHCELCGEEWPYSRIKCPFCNTQDQEKLGYFEAEEEEGFRVYFCRECSRYLKTIDKKAFEEVAPLELENLATIHLDLLANEHGFK